MHALSDDKRLETERSQAMWLGKTVQLFKCKKKNCFHTMKITEVSHHYHSAFHYSSTKYCKLKLNCKLFLTGYKVILLG